MPYRNLGTVSHESHSFPGAVRHRFRWITNSSGDAVLYIPSLVAASMFLAVCKHSTSGSGTYTVTLIDDLDSDWLNSLLATMTINTVTQKVLHRTVTDGAAKWSRDLTLGAEVYFRITHTSASTYEGVTDFYARA